MTDKEKSGSEKSINEVDRLYNTTSQLTADNLRLILGGSSDFVCRMLLIRDKPEIPAMLAYIDGLADSDIISSCILQPLIQNSLFDSCNSESEASALISTGAVSSASIKAITNMKDLVDDILSGNAALIFNSEKIAFTFGARSELSRAIAEPTGENVIKGSKDSFVENLRTNTALCRLKLKTPYLEIEEIKLGKQTKTKVEILYLKNIAADKLVKEVKKRIKAVDIDKIMTPGLLEEYIVDDKYSTFPQIMSTERPDRLCSNLVEGRVGIIIEGMPLTYVVPGTLLQFFQTPDDYSVQFIIGSVLRLLRFLSLFLTLVLPGFYICITTFHTEMLPAELAFSIVASKEGVPFPMFVEVIILLIAFELLVEAGLRLPKTIGQTVSIVGALVVGQAAVEAKILSPATVIVIALTAIASFTLPNQDFSNSIRLWRFLFVILSSIIGMLGLTFGLIFMLYHLCRLESFGVPYLDPFVANEDEQLQDSIFRLPVNMMKKRPSSLNPKNSNRME